MSETPPNGSNTNDEAFGSDTETKTENGIGIERVLYMLLYAVLAWVTLWVMFVMAVVQLIVVLVSNKPNKELAGFARNGAQYMFEMMAYLGFARDETPFPFGKFPDVPDVD